MQISNIALISNNNRIKQYKKEQPVVTNDVVSETVKFSSEASDALRVQVLYNPSFGARYNIGGLATFLDEAGIEINPNNYPQTIDRIIQQCIREGKTEGECLLLVMSALNEMRILSDNVRESYINAVQNAYRRQNQSSSGGSQGLTPADYSNNDRIRAQIEVKNYIDRCLEGGIKEHECLNLLQRMLEDSGYTDDEFRNRCARMVHASYRQNGGRVTRLLNLDLDFYTNLVNTVKDRDMVDNILRDMETNPQYDFMLRPVGQENNEDYTPTSDDFDAFSGIRSLADDIERERYIREFENLIGRTPANQSSADRKQQIIDKIVKDKNKFGLGADSESSPLIKALFSKPLIPFALELIPLCTTEEINAMTDNEKRGAYPILLAAASSIKPEELLSEFLKRDDVDTYVTDADGNDIYKYAEKQGRFENQLIDRLKKMVDDYRAAHPRTTSAGSTNGWSSQPVGIRSEKAVWGREKLSEKEKIDTYLFELNKKFYNANIKVATGPFVFAPPKEYSSVTSEYNNMKSNGHSDWTIFGSYALNSRDGGDRYDYVIAQMLKDKKFPVMKRYDSGYNVGCDPLFILTTLNKPYLVQEALKLPDADPLKTTGMNMSISSWRRAVSINGLDCVYVMLKSGKITKSAIEEAKSYAPSQQMRELLNAYPDVDEYMNSISNRYSEALTINVKSLEDVLVTPGVDPKFVDSNGNSILHLVGELDDEVKAVSIIENAVKNKNLDINAKNNDGLTPIEIYLDKGKYLLVAKMLTLKADISTFNDKFQNSFAHLLVMSPNEEEAIRLLDYAHENGYDLNKGDCIGVTPFARAVKLRKYKIMTYYIGSGISTNIQDKNGRTPLHYACMLNDPKEIEMLLNSFASTSVEDNYGKVPGDYLRDPEVIRFYEMFDAMK